MLFDKPSTDNPIDRMTVVGKPVSRIDGPLKVTGTAAYAYERHDVAPNQAYGYVFGSAIPKGRIRAMDVSRAKAASGVLAVVTAENAGPLKLGRFNSVMLLGGPDIAHYHQALGVVVAETFEEARAAARLIDIDYEREEGAFDLAAQAANAPFVEGEVHKVGDFEAAFESADVKVDASFTTPDHTHAMMEPHATLAAWDGDKLTIWTSNQMIAWTHGDIARTLGMPKENVRLESPFVGGGFGGKLFLRSDALMAALGARAAGRPVKVALPRPFIANNTTHRPATIQRVRLGASRDGRITAIGHESLSGNLPGGPPEDATQQTRLIYAGENRLTQVRQALLDLPEGHAMRAPGEAPGMMALEVAMDELAEKLGMDPVDLRIVNDTHVDPSRPERRFSERRLVECLKLGAERFGWADRTAPGQRREGNWLIGMGVAAGFRNNLVLNSGARVRLDNRGHVTVETDMTDIGTGSYTIIAQTAAEMLGVGVENVTVKLGDSSFPVSAGSGGQFGANSATAGVYAACVKLREAVLARAGFNSAEAEFVNGQIRAGNRAVRLADAAGDAGVVAEDRIEFEKLSEEYQQSTFAAHFAEVAVDAATGETRVRRMLAVCDAGRILNPKTARSQVIGAMTMGVGGTLMEHLVVDKRAGFFVNHDLAGYEVPVHADIQRQDVIFLDGADPVSSPMKAKGVGELGLCGVGAAVANAIYNATGIRVRDYPITLDKLLLELPG